MEEAEELQAIHDRHMDVNDEQINFPIPQDREALCSVRGHEHVPQSFRVADHEVPENFQKAHIVVDKQDRCPFCCHALRQPAGNLPRLARAPATFISAMLVEDSSFLKKKNQAGGVESWAVSPRIGWDCRAAWWRANSVSSAGFQPILSSARAAAWRTQGLASVNPPVSGLASRASPMRPSASAPARRRSLS